MPSIKIGNLSYEIDSTGGGGGSVAIKDEGSVIVAAATSIDFVGAGVTATSGGAGLATVTIPGGGAGTVTSITAGTGLTGGTITGSGTIAIDSSVTTQASALTSTRVPYANVSGILTDSAALTFSAGTLTATAFSGSGAALTTLDATNVSSGTLADARLSSNVPLKNAANIFTGLPQTVTHNAIGNILTPTLDLVLQNDTLSTAYANPQNSPSLVFLGHQWSGLELIPISRTGGAALFFKPIAGTGSTGILRAAYKHYDTQVWESSFDFPTNGPYGVQEGVSYYSHRYKGSYQVFEPGIWIPNVSGYTPYNVLFREPATDNLIVRSTGVAAPIKAQDSAGSLTQVQALSYTGSGAALTNLNASNITTGTLANARLTEEIANASNDAFMLMGC